MPCYHPLRAFRSSSGEILFSDRGDTVGELDLPCGRCVGCRLERSRQWATRIMFESQFHDSSCFITLTYDDEYCPLPPSLDYSDFQLFMKRLRKSLAPKRLRFFCAGEYGDLYGRPHFHACIFGHDFPDRVFDRRSRSGFSLYTSHSLEDVWKYGYSSVAELSFESAAYVARYCMKKITGDMAEYHYCYVDSDTGEVSFRVPEFARMSLRPGIGGAWFDKYKDSDLVGDYVVVNGRKVKPPRYFDKLLERVDPDRFSDVVAERELGAAARLRRGDGSYRRLADKEAVQIAALSRFLPRGDL